MAENPKRKNNDNQGLLGAQLARLRQQRGYSMQKLARETGISAAYICRIEGGERHPSKDLLDTLANFLLPETNQAEKDELFIAAGFAPNNFRNFMGRQDVMAIYEKELAKNPLNFKIYIALVLSLIRAGRHQLASQQINEGMQRFDDIVQLHALMAALELSKQNYPQAVRFQEDAIRNFHLVENKDSLNLRLSDLLLSLGVIHFERGHLFAYGRLRCQAAQDTAGMLEQEQQALGFLKAAQRAFREALEVDPLDVYILDELARVSFTMAYLQSGAEAEKAWKATLKAFEQVLSSPDKQSLGYHSLLQSTAFLALAYSKAGKFDKAWFTINVVEACLPNFWLIHYVKACYYGLQIRGLMSGTSAQTEALEPLYESCLQSLKKAASVKDDENMTREEARLDPDLEPLRNYNPKAFAAITEGALQSE